MLEKLTTFFKDGFEINLSWVKSLINKIKSIVNAVKTYIGSDGVKHIAASCFICIFVCSILFGIFCINGIKAIVSSLIVTLFIGIIKELLDLAFPNHSAEIKDIICDIIGIAIAVPICLLFI